MTTRTTALVQTAAELYIEAQVVARRSTTDARFTPAQRADALTELARLCGNTAAAIRRLAETKDARRG